MRPPTIMAPSSSITSAAKQLLRKDVKQRLSAMSAEERERQSLILTEKILGSAEYKNSERICLYLSMKEEVDTKDVLKHVFTSGKSCFIPRYTKTDMEMLRIKSYEEYAALPTTKWNIKQPDCSEGREEALTSGGLDLMLVPGLAFTKDGCRLGRGKGYYDTYLDKCANSNEGKIPITIGLAFKEQIVDEIPMSDHDKRVDKVFYLS